MLSLVFCLLQEKEDGGTEGKPKMRFWLEKPAEEHKDTSTASTALSSAASSATSSSSSSSYIADPFRSASSMLKGGEGPLTENSSAFDLSSHAAATAVSSSSSQQPPESASSSVRQYVLLSENDMMQSVDAYLTAPLSRVLVDKLLPSGHYSRSSEPASFRNFSIGDKLDAKDTIQKWYVSNVRDVKDGKVFIHFNNWDTKWDEVSTGCTFTSLHFQPIALSSLVLLIQCVCRSCAVISFCVCV